MSGQEGLTPAELETALARAVCTGDHLIQLRPDLYVVVRRDSLGRRLVAIGATGDEALSRARPIPDSEHAAAQRARFDQLAAARKAREQPHRDRPAKKEIDPEVLAARKARDAAMDAAKRAAERAERARMAAERAARGEAPLYERYRRAR